VSHANPEAARLADKLRTAIEDQALRGPAIADRVEGLTGVRPSAMTVSRWLSGERPLIRVSPHLRVLAEVAGLDPLELVHDAIAPELTEPAS
jgi:transcriptional regulator with XRE-family HTH domain